MAHHTFGVFSISYLCRVIGELPPLSVYEKDSVKLVIHFAQNKPRDDVDVMVISITSTKDVPIKSVIFQAAVPKVITSSLLFKQT